MRIPCGSKLATAGAVLLGALMIATAAAAQPQYEILHAFTGPPGGARGQLLRGSNGVIYGMTALGGSTGAGTIFAVRIQGDGAPEVTILHQFSDADGGGPVAALVEGGDGALYGTTPEHGASGLGTVFKITTAGEFTLLHAFNGADGAKPLAALVEGGDGNFYGVTSEGGASNLGTVFRITPAGTLTTVHTFAADPGGRPRAPLVRGADGQLYGITFEGSGEGATGPYTPSTVFKMSLDGDFTTLYTFPSMNLARGLIQGTDGNFYGFVRRSLIPVVDFFRMTPDGTLTVVSTLPDVRTIGDPYDEVPLTLAPDGSFYGTFSLEGPNGFGTAFNVAPDGTFVVLHAFTASEGSSSSGVIDGGDGLYYGVAFSGGGYSDRGSAFSMTIAGNVHSLPPFPGGDGATPVSSPVRGTDGALYLTTAAGGTFDLGTITRLASDGAASVLHSFSDNDGAHPSTSLVQARDGLFYGTALKGGCNGRGTIFRMSAAGDFAVLHCFLPGEGRYPASPLTESPDGFLYGTTIRGGANDDGTVFRISPSGEFTTLYSFARDVTSAFPMGPLVRTDDGTLYGSTAGPSDAVGGSVFMMTPAGTVTLLHTYTQTERFDPLEGVWVTVPAYRIQTGLTTASDGSFYGGACCSNYQSEVFRVAPDGTFTGSSGALLPAFGGYLVSPPLEAHDGMFYSVITSRYGLGTIYRFSGGTTELVKNLTEDEGTHPIGGLLEGPPGTFYGTTARGGPYGGGVVFRLTVP